MVDTPSRTAVKALVDAANAVVPVMAAGFARKLDDGRVSVVYAYPHGFSEYILANSDLADVLQPSSDGPRVADRSMLNANVAIEWQLFYGQAQSIYSIRLDGFEPATRFWVGLASPEPLTGEQRRALDAVGETSVSALTDEITPDEALRRLQRLELAAALLPPLLHILDVREVFDRLSAISKAALPHDMLTLGIFDEDFTTVTLFARTGAGSDLGRTFPQPYPRSVSQAWTFDIIDDRSKYPLEQDRPPTKLGMKSSLRLPFTFDGRVIGALAFIRSNPRNIRMPMSWSRGGSRITSRWHCHITGSRSSSPNRRARPRSSAHRPPTLNCSTSCLRT
jgi:hypothetical protein